MDSLPQSVFIYLFSIYNWNIDQYKSSKNIVLKLNLNVNPFV